VLNSFNKNNKIPKGPDKILRDKKEKTCLLIDVDIPDDSNINTEEIERLNKYKDLEIAVSRMWKVRTKIVPVTTGALGTIKNGLVQNRQLPPGHRSARKLQKFTLMSTAHSVGKCWGKPLRSVVEIWT
jgi:hypothetical protein